MHFYSRSGYFISMDSVKTFKSKNRDKIDLDATNSLKRFKSDSETFTEWKSLLNNSNRCLGDEFWIFRMWPLNKFSIKVRLMINYWNIYYWYFTWLLKFILKTLLSLISGLVRLYTELSQQHARKFTLYSPLKPWLLESIKLEVRLNSPCPYKIWGMSDSEFSVEIFSITYLVDSCFWWLAVLSVSPSPMSHSWQVVWLKCELNLSFGHGFFLSAAKPHLWPAKIK